MDEVMQQYIRTSQALFVNMQQSIAALTERVKVLEDMLARRNSPEVRRVRRTREAWEQVKALKGNGMSVRSIAAQTGLPSSTVYRYLQTDEEAAKDLPHL